MELLKSRRFFCGSAYTHLSDLSNSGEFKRQTASEIAI